MYRKNKKWIRTVGIVLFFLVGGVWYLLQRKETAQGQAELKGILEDADNVSGTPALLPATVFPPTPTQEPSLVVYVCGAVNNPGVYTLPAGSRLYEAVELAGGFTAEADASCHNLARGIADGERIYILTMTETKEWTTEQRVNGESVADATQPEDSSVMGTTQIDLNTATLEQLTTLPGIGEAKAESILEYRTKVGTFTDIEELMNISGIGEAIFEKIKDRITVK